MASKTLLMLALLCASPLVSAQTVGALSELQSETIMIKAKAEQEKARASLLEAKGAPSASASADAEPVFLGIFGGERTLYARFALDGGAVVEVREGDPIIGGYRVAKLTANDIVLTKHGRRWQIRMPGGQESAPEAAPAGLPVAPLPSPLPPPAPSTAAPAALR